MLIRSVFLVSSSLAMMLLPLSAPVMAQLARAHPPHSRAHHQRIHRQQSVPPRSFNAQRENRGGHGTITLDADGLIWGKEYWTDIEEVDTEVGVVALDTWGNALVASSTDEVFTVLKYSPDGEPLWAVTHIPGGDDISLQDMQTDDEGNVYLTGHGGLNAIDLLVFKISGDGRILWESRYDGPAHLHDGGAALAVHPDGSVTVVGTSNGDGTGEDIVTVHFTADGEQVWAARYNGGGSDFGKLITLFENGDICVVGSSTTATRWEDITVIRYSSAGVERWSVPCGAPGESRNYARGAVTSGETAFLTAEINAAGVPSDVMTIAFSGTGEELWRTTFDGVTHSWDSPAGIVLDSQHRPYIAGTTYNDSTRSRQIFVSGYTAGGSVRWHALLDRPHDTHDRAYGLFLVADTCLRIGGVQGQGDVDLFMAVSYSTMGQLLQDTLYSIPEGEDDFLVVAPTGAALLGRTLDTGPPSEYDGALTYFSPAGSVQWDCRFDGAANPEEYVEGLELDSHDNLVVELSSNGLFGSAMTTLKYDPAGRLLWSARHDGAGAWHEADPAAMRVGPTGDVYVVGTEMLDSSRQDIAILKYDSLGGMRWIRHLGRRFNDVGKGLAVDASGNVFVTGSSIDSLFHFSALTAKYDSTGMLLWADWYSGPGSTGYDGSEAVLDGHGGIYVAGTSFDAFIVMHYTAAGIREWVSTYAPGAEFSTLYHRGLGVDGQGNVVLTGSGFSSVSNEDIITVSFRPDGALRWGSMYSGPGQHPDEPEDILVQPDGAVYVVGTGHDGTDYDMLTLKYDSLGVLLWSDRFDGPAERWDGGQAGDVDQQGNLVVAGWTETADGTEDIVLRKYTTSGSAIWTHIGASVGWVDQYPIAASVDGSGHIVLAGERSSAAGQTAIVMKYREDPSLDAGLDTPTPGVFMLGQNYPNPFNPSTTIRYVVPERTGVCLKVYDILGREVTTIVDEQQEAGEHVVHWVPARLSSGVYICRMEAGRFSKTMKMMLMK